MAMTSTRYVTQMPDGAFMVVYDGNVTYTETQQEAEQLFNQLEAQSGGSVGAGQGLSVGSGGGDAFNWGGLWGSMAGSNQQRFDEMVRQFNEQQRLASQGQYAGLATSLLNGALSARGPSNWLNYSQYTNGGRNIFQQLYGDQPAPTFGAPTGYSQPQTIQDILAALGLVSQPGGMPAGQSTGTPGTATGAGEANPNMAPLPYQINPGVWDSLSGTARQMVLASAEQGNTPSGAWSAEDYLGQLNASRPKGNAPRQVAYNWGGQKSLY